MRRLSVASLAFLAMTGTLLALPVYAAPAPAPHPVESSVDEIALGSVVEPTDVAVVAVDGEVQADGGGEATGSLAADPADEAPVSEAAASNDVVVSGDEVQGVPALTVSEPDTQFFESVGVTWRDSPEVVDVVVQLRVQLESGLWGEWTTLESEGVDRTPGAGERDEGLRAGTAPYWTGPATGVEAIVQGAGGAVPEDVRVILIDPGTSEADSLPSAAPGAQADAAMAMPPVITRAQWGADESIMDWTPQYVPTIKAATVHHTAGKNDYTAADVPRIIRSIQAYHSVSLNWGDIGYNVIVDKFGRIFEGRYGGLSSTVIGAHARGFNSGTFGVSMLGDYDRVDVPQVTVDALSAIIAWKFSLYGVNPSGTTVLNQQTVPTIFAHRDVGSTACPGRYGYAKLPAIRVSVAGRFGQADYVRALYQDMMGRGPDAVGLDGWTSALISGADRRVVSRGFSDSSEYRMLSITQAYRQVFDRVPDPSGVNTWMTAVANGSVRLDDLRPRLMASEEFYNRGGSSDAAFVDNLYQASLGRGAGASEIEFWGDLRRSEGPTPVINAIWGSAEAGMRRVDQTYQYYLGRGAGRSEQEHWLGIVLGQGAEQLREEIMISAEYFLRAGNRFS